MSANNLLFSPIKVGEKEIPNRFAVNAMECCDADDNGNPSEKTYRRYEKYFEGLSGFISLEAITCQYDNISSTKQLSLMPRNEKPMKKFVNHLKELNENNIFIFQLTHSGEVSHPTLSRRIRVTKEPLYGYEDARLIDESEIKTIMEQFVKAAIIAHDVGADGIDLKLCTGYLGSQILRPFNKHLWKYGGSWERRRQFAFDLIEHITKAVNDKNFIIGSKISVYEGFPGGQGTAGPDSALMDLFETVDLVKGLEERGAKYFVETAGGPLHSLTLSKPDKSAPDYTYMHFYFQKALKDALKPETTVIGSCYSIFRDGNGTKFKAVSPENNGVLYWGNKNIKEGITDMISLGRQSLADASIPKKIIENKQEEIKWCTACDHCSLLLISQKDGGCAVYDEAYRETFRSLKINL